MSRLLHVLSACSRFTLSTPFVFALALTLAACGGNSPSTISPDAAQAPQQTSTAAPLPTRAVTARNTVTADGVLSPKSAPIAYAAEVNAKVTSVNVESGQAVKMGDVLATLDDTTLRDALADAELQLKLVEAEIANAEASKNANDVESARAALAAAQAQYEQVKRGPSESEIEQAKLNLDSAWDGYLAAQVNRDVACDVDKDGPVCKQQEASYGNTFENWVAARDSYNKILQPVSAERLAQAQASVASARARLDQAQAGQSDEQQAVNAARLNNARSGVKRAQDNLRQTTVLSPCNCVVQEMNISVGAVPKGVAFTLVNLAGMQFKTTNLSERDLTNMRLGNTATIRLRAFDEPFSGKVAAILPQSSGAQGGAALFTVLIDLDPATATLLPGMSGIAEIDARP